jgi:hypothetical protein
MLGVVIGAVAVLLVGAFALSIVGIGITNEAIKTFKENN